MFNGCIREAEATSNARCSIIPQRALRPMVCDGSHACIVWIYQEDNQLQSFRSSTFKVLIPWLLCVLYSNVNLYARKTEKSTRRRLDAVKEMRHNSVNIEKTYMNSWRRKGMGSCGMRGERKTHKKRRKSSIVVWEDRGPRGSGKKEKNHKKSTCALPSLPH